MWCHRNGVMAASNSAMEARPTDALVLGGGPAALAMAAALAEQGLRVVLLAPHDPRAPWANTYGIWGEEVDALGLAHLLEHRWSHTVSYFGPGDQPTPHHRDYGLFNRQALQRHWLAACDRGGVEVLQGKATQVELVEGGAWSELITAEGSRHRARLVVDATGPMRGLWRGRRPTGSWAAFRRRRWSPASSC
jgi:lycopene cyclase-like protein